MYTGSIPVLASIQNKHLQLVRFVLATSQPLFRGFADHQTKAVSLRIPESSRLRGKACRSVVVHDAVFAAMDSTGAGFRWSHGFSRQHGATLCSIRCSVEASAASVQPAGRSNPDRAMAPPLQYRQATQPCGISSAGARQRRPGRPEAHDAPGHVAQDREPVSSFPNMQNQWFGVYRVNADARDTLYRSNRTTRRGHAKTPRPVQGTALCGCQAQYRAITPRKQAAWAA